MKLRVTSYELPVFFFLLLVGTGTFFAGRGCDEKVRTETRIDTLIVRDTLRDTVLVPVARYIARADTVWMRAAGDTVRVEVEVPVERKVYATEDYRAVVEGFRPALVEMELYHKTTIVTKESTLRSPPSRWGIGIQAGVGFTPKGAMPYIGIGIQYRVASW